MRAALVLLGLAAAAAVASAQSSDAPLSDTKKQLQSLQRDRAAEKTGANPGASGLRDAITTVESPAPVALPPPPTTKSLNERDARQKDEARRNWLLDGYDKLNRRRDGLPADRPGVTDPAAEEKPLDPADPDYFLRVYEKQRAETLQRREEAAARETRAPAAGAQDAFAPFMQDWLAGSPVREVLRDAAGTKTEPSRSDSAMPAATGDGPVKFNLPFDPNGAGQGGGVNLPTANPNTGSATTNPFVQALGLPATPEARTLDFRPTPAPAASGNPTTLPALPSLIPPFVDKPAGDARQAPPPPNKDAKKYFPQLKKF